MILIPLQLLECVDLGMKHDVDIPTEEFDLFDKLLHEGDVLCAMGAAAGVDHFVSPYF